MRSSTRTPRSSADGRAKKLDYVKLLRVVKGKGKRLPQGLSWEAYDDILHIIRFGIAPTAGAGREDLPLEVYTWLMPVQQAIDRAQRDAQKEAAAKR